MLGHHSSERTPVSVSVPLEEEPPIEVVSNLTGIKTKKSVNSLLNANYDDDLESLSSFDVAELVVQDLNEFVEVRGDSGELGTAKARMSCKEQTTAI